MIEDIVLPDVLNLVQYTYTQTELSLSNKTTVTKKSWTRVGLTKEH